MLARLTSKLRLHQRARLLRCPIPRPLEPITEIPDIDDLRSPDDKLIDDLSTEWPVGSALCYLKQACVVIGHCHFEPFGPYGIRRAPGLDLRYVDNGGVFHTMRLGRDESRALMEAARASTLDTPSKSELAATTGNRRVVPSHRCTRCGALWRYWPSRDGGPEDSWNLYSRVAGECCDNAPMGKQIVPLRMDELLRRTVFEASESS